MDDINTKIVPAEQADDDFTKLLATLWRRRWWIIAGLLLGIGAAAAGMVLVKPVYRSTVVAFPADTKQGFGGLSSLLSQYSDVASLAGMDLGETNVTPEAMAILDSHKFTESFIVANGLMPILFKRDWDPNAKAWKPGRRHQKTLWDGYDYFTRNVRTVNQDRKSGLLTIDIDWKDRDLAARWANATLAQLNSEMRQRTIDEATNMVDYLNKELAHTDDLSLRETMNKVVESEIKERALAIVRPEYAYRVVDPGEPADLRNPQRPRARVYFVFGPIAGLIGGIILALIIEQLSVHRRRRLRTARD